MISAWFFLIYSRTCSISAGEILVGSFRLESMSRYQLGVFLTQSQWRELMQKRREKIEVSKEPECFLLMRKPKSDPY